ncbi:MAG: glycosyltransferase family 2 protein [Planctomycetes bacterium]|nr:glycosyltransferase family 2 protein [Planctomycetota bacterium]
MISIVIPLHNERESLPLLYDEIAAVASRHRLDMEVIFVDDGSTDGSWAVIAGLARKSPASAPIGQDNEPTTQPLARGIRFRRQFGKAAALAAGVRAARGDVLITMDADLQDDPAEIPRFLQTLENDLDVVNGWKRHRRDPWHKVLPSRVFNLLVSWLTGLRLHDHNCGMKCYRAELFREIRLYGELHRFIPVLAHARGYRVGEIAIHHRRRRFGRSKYGPARFLKGFLDLLTVKFLTGFGQRPQHLLGGIGMLAFAAGAAGLTYLAVLWVLIHFVWHTHEKIGDRPLLIYSVSAMLLGAQMMSIGFLAELITAYQSRTEESYSIAEEIGGEAEASRPPSRPAQAHRSDTRACS